MMKKKRDKMKVGRDRQKREAADLCAGHVVVRRSQPHCGDAPSSRLVASPNLWPRHLRLFVRLLLEPKRWSRPITSVLIAFLTVTSVVAAPADPPSQAIPAAVFATDTNAAANAERVVSGAAAVVDAHIVPMDDVFLACLRKYRSYIIDQIVQGYVIDRECKRRGITVSESEIDKQVEDLRKNLAPSTLDETLEKHHKN